MAKTKAIEFKDKFTLDGRAKPQLGVTPAKVQAVQSCSSGTSSSK